MIRARNDASTSTASIDVHNKKRAGEDPRLSRTVRSNFISTGRPTQWPPRSSSLQPSIPAKFRHSTLELPDCVPSNSLNPFPKPEVYIGGAMHKSVDDPFVVNKSSTKPTIESPAESDPSSTLGSPLRHLEDSCSPLEISQDLSQFKLTWDSPRCLPIPPQNSPNSTAKNPRTSPTSSLGRSECSEEHQFHGLETSFYLGPREGREKGNMPQRHLSRALADGQTMAVRECDVEGADKTSERSTQPSAVSRKPENKFQGPGLPDGVYGETPGEEAE
jgi:hypothetical protein